MKAWLYALFAFVIAAFVFATGVSAQSDKVIYFFYGQGCPHCAVVEDYFEKEGIYNRYPIEKKEIYSNRENAVFYNETLDMLGIPQEERGVPLVVFGKRFLFGDRPIIAGFTTEADAFLHGVTPANPATTTVQEQQNRSLPDLTLAAVVAASAVDAINPCAFAVLIILMTAVLATGDGKRALKAGLAFSLSVFISYFLMGLGLYKALSIGGVSAHFYTIVGWLAIVVGLLNLKDYFWYGKGFLMEVPMGWRPALKRLIRSATTPAGAFGIGFLVSLFLLPCTSGPYVVILGMLAQKTYFARAILYLLLYNLIFVLPMVLITLAVYHGFNPERAEEMRQKRLRTLHLIAGLIMLAMGVVIVAGWL